MVFSDMAYDRLGHLAGKWGVEEYFSATRGGGHKRQITQVEAVLVVRLWISCLSRFSESNC